MRGVLLAMTVVVAACGDHGIAVVVTSQVPNVETVRLYVGVDDPMTTDLTNVSGVVADNAKYWARDPGNADDLHTGFKDKTTFYYETDIGAPVAIAVGYDGQNNPIAAGVHVGLLPSQDNNTFAVTSIEMQAAGPFSTAQSTTAVEVSVWSQPDHPQGEQADCAGIITSDGPVFIVTKDDQDCDGLLDNTAGECTPDTYLGTTVDAGKPGCLVSNVSTECRIGGTICADTGAPMTTNAACAPSNTCLPARICGKCMADYECAADVVTSVTPASYACTVSVDSSNKICAQTFAIARPPTGGYACATGGRKLLIADAMNDPDSKLVAGQMTIQTSLDNSQSCAGSLAISGGGPAQMLPVGALISFPLTNNGSVAFPIQFNFVGAPAACSSLPPTATCAFVDETDYGQIQCVSEWGTPVAVPVPAGLTLGGIDPRVTFNDTATELYYSNAGQLMRSQKSANGWTAPQPFSLITAGPTDTKFFAPELSVDGKRMVVVGTSATATVSTLYVATRSDATNDLFTSATPILDNQVSDRGWTSATFAPDDDNHVSHLIAAAGGAGAGLYDVAYTATNPLTQTPIAFDFVAADGSANHPHLNGDGTQLYFDLLSASGSAIRVASRRSATDTWALSTRIPELTGSTPGKGSCPWVSNDGKTAFYLTTGTNPVLMTATRTNLN